MGFHESMVDYRAGLSLLSDNSLVEYVISTHINNPEVYFQGNGPTFNAKQHW